MYKNKYIIFPTVLLFLFILLYIFCQYLKYKGIYFSDIFVYIFKTDKKRREHEEAIKNFGVHMKGIFLNMNFENNLSIPPSRIAECYTNIENKYRKAFKEINIDNIVVFYFYDASSGVFLSRYRKIIRILAAATISEIKGNNFYNNIIITQIFKELEHELIKKTVEKEIILRLVLNMKKTLKRSIKACLQEHKSIFKSLVQETVFFCDHISVDFKTTKNISSMLINTISDKLTSTFADRITFLYGNYLKEDLAITIENHFKLERGFKENIIEDFIEKFKFELGIVLSGDLKTLVYSLLNNILKKIKRTTPK